MSCIHPSFGTFLLRVLNFLVYTLAPSSCDDILLPGTEWCSLAAGRRSEGWGVPVYLWGFGGWLVGWVQILQGINDDKCIYKPKWPLFWLEVRPCFGGFNPQNRGHTGSRYIYIYVSHIGFTSGVDGWIGMVHPIFLTGGCNLRFPTPSVVINPPSIFQRWVVQLVKSQGFLGFKSCTNVVFYLKMFTTSFFHI